MMPLAIGGAAVLGAVAGWIAALVAGRVLEERDEDLPPMPEWVLPATGVAVAGAFAAVPPVIEEAWLIPAYLWFVWLTMTLVVTDVHSQLIPNRISYRGTAIAAVLLIVGALGAGLSDSLIRAGWGALIYYALTMVLYIAGRGAAFGGGDVKLSVVLGLFTAFLGWDRFVPAVVLGILIGGLAGVALMLIRSKGLREHFAYGPPMVLGAYIAIVWGEAIVDWYLV